MLDVKFIREHIDLVKKGAEIKRIKVDLDRLLDLDNEMRPLQLQLEKLLADRNRLSKDIGKASPADREVLKTAVQDIKGKVETITETLKPKKEEYDALMLLVPAPPAEGVPVGKDDSENVPIRHVGEVPKFSFTPKDHAALGERLGIIDVQRGVKLAGSRSYVLKGDGALLEQAVLRYTYDKLVKKGYTPLSIPVLVKEDAMVGTGYFPIGREQAYCVEKDALVLVGTAEVSLTSFYSDETLEESALPVRFFAQSPCFRREAGTYGKDAKGLYRVHQFQKIEQVIVCKNDIEESKRMHAEILGNAESILQDFGLPYRVVDVCTGDLGQGQVRKNDIETWMPSRNGYGETHSCSTFYEFQARRLKLRYKDKTGKTLFCHTLNNTAIATPRIMICLLECFQEADGRVRIPEVLRPYMGGKSHIG